MASTKFSKPNLLLLRNEKKQRKDHDLCEGSYSVEGILNKRSRKNVKGQIVVKYQLKIRDFETTLWEPKKNIPPFIVDYYEKTKKTTIPLPRIKSERKIGSQREIQLSWGEDDENLEEFIPISDLVVPDKEYEKLEVSCNTRKNIARIYRRSAGVFVGVLPCGIYFFVHEHQSLLLLLS